MTTVQPSMVTDYALEPLSVEEVMALPASFPAWPIVARILCIRRTAFYEGARQDTLPIPLFRVNRQLIGRKVDVLRFLGLQDAAVIQSAALANGDGPGGATPDPSVEQSSAPTSK